MQKVSANNYVKKLEKESVVKGALQNGHAPQGFIDSLEDVA